MLKVEALPSFRDNYIWAITDGRHSVLVDPGEAGPVMTWLKATNITPAALLITHHHADHCGGVADLTMNRPLPVYGPAAKAIPGVTHPVAEGDTVAIPALGLDLQVLATPGHTRGHVCYHGDGRLFAGDTLFSCGCGRLFEGTAEQMHASLSRLAGLPGETRLHCAHEYTLANLAFALELEPEHPALLARRQEAADLRKSGRPTLPSNLASERASNPFLRCHEPALAQALGDYLGRSIPPGLPCFTALRALKDTF